MNTSYAAESYRAHDLNISMKTSSGDTIEMDFANHQSSSLSHQENKQSSQTSFSFSSMQSFSYKFESNGISAQDQKEIDAFMQTAQPFIDNFLKELKDDAPGSPVTKLATKIADIFEPSKARDENQKNHVKSNIVDMFDKSLQELKEPKNTETLDLEKMMDKIFKDAQKLLEKTLKEFEKLNTEIYA